MRSCRTAGDAERTTITARVKADPAVTATRQIEGVILDPDGKPAAGAVVVAGFAERRSRTTKSSRPTPTADSHGRFPMGRSSVYFVAHKEGLAPAIWMRWLNAEMRGDHVERRLRKPEPFSAILVDAAGHPVAGARVRIEMFAHSSSSQKDQHRSPNDHDRLLVRPPRGHKRKPARGLVRDDHRSEWVVYLSRVRTRNVRLKLGVTPRGRTERCG